MRPLAARLAACLAAVASCAPEPPPRPDAGGLAFLPEAHTDLVLAVRDPDGGAADAGVAAPARPAAAPLLSAEATLADGSPQPLSRDGVTTVDPSARFRLEVGARLPDARLVLLDAQDAMVPADGAVEATAATRFALSPATPLRPGAGYTLRLEGADGRLLRAEDGGSWEPASLALRVSGVAPAPPRKAKRRRGR